MKILAAQNMSHREIANILNVSKSAVTRGLARIKEVGSLRSRIRSGRPRVTTPASDRLIRRASVANPSWSSKRIALELRPVPSSRTVRRRLLTEFKLPSRKPARKSRLSKKNIKDRMTFCKKYRHWTVDQWNTVLFSDESTFSQFSSYVRHVRRPVNSRYKARYVVPTVKQAPTVMVWGSFCGNGRCGLWFMPKNTTINGQVYLSILQEKLMPHMNIHNCTIFQQDGAPCHRTAAVTTWIRGQGIEILGPWPGSSPDLNPIENLWYLMKQKVAERLPTSEASLKNVIKEVWIKEVMPDYCRRLVSSMPARIKACIASKGQHTKY